MSSSSIRPLLTVAVGYIIICSHILADKEIKGPVIIPSKSDVILRSGQNFTIFCKSRMPVQIKQQHIPENDVGPFYKKHRNITSSDDSILNEFETALDLYNVDRYAIGYYACFDSSVNESSVLNNLQKEPNNTEHISYIYIYVDDTGKLFAPMREMVISTPGATVVIECRPTTPDVNVTLLGDFPDSDYKHYFSPKIGFTFSSDALLDIPMTGFFCNFVRENQNDTIEVYVQKLLLAETPRPNIVSQSKYFLEGESFWLNCTVDYELNNPVLLDWIKPREFTKSKVVIETNEETLKTAGTLYKTLTIIDANAENDGDYTCTSSGAGPEQSTITKVYKGKTGFINITMGNLKNPIETKQSKATLVTIVNDAYPPANYTFYKNDKEILVKLPKYEIKEGGGKVNLVIYKLNINDTANYTVVAANKDVSKKLTFDVRKIAYPVINFGSGDKRFLLNTVATLQCEAVGYPLPNIRWYFTTETGEQQEISSMAENKVESLTKVTSYLTIPVHASGNITCSPGKQSDVASVTRRFLVYEVPNGFGVVNSHKTWYSEGQEAIIECYASRYDFHNVTWIRNNKTLSDFVTILDTALSFIARLKISSVSINDAGAYTCHGHRKDDSEESQTVSVTVAERRPPNITIPASESNEEVNPYQPVRLTCQANAVPPPVINWYKDGERLENNTFVDIFTDYLDHMTVNSTIDIKQMLEEHKGKYECIAESGDTSVSESYNLIIKEKSPYKSAIYLSIIGIVVFILVLLIVYLIWKIRKEKQFRKELAAAGLLYFKEGVTRSLNPELGIDEQAELLPYDERFEFPPEKLQLGKQLGAGAFGVVYKAEARGIINAEETTPVAVKMVKKTADNMYIKALASELKIMVHLGKHVNIVNLLGACTKNVGKRELVVIVEYCKFGNIHNYMQRHREVFIDQLTDDKEKNLGKVNRGFICNTGSTGVQSDYFGSNHSQETDHTFVNTANTNRSGRKDNANETVEFVRVSETGYVQPEWRSNYETDYVFDGRNPRPLTSRDLLAWAFQIARGMEYLASRKVLHGDLAARNVLLAEDNIVKICDFGLARSIYKNDEYRKQENSPLPVKWLAIECMTDRIFSTQSDVWSFGIVLWELFSLAKTPYPNVSPTSLVQWLSDGHRLEKPQYADDRLYDVMMRCWEQKPTARPNFSQLQEILGSFLEDNVRNHYVDLNSVFMDSNVKAEGEEDYLAMVCAPDYNNMVTPSPHQYVNDSRNFFPATPTQLLHDDEGYLQMSPANQNIFSPRTLSNKFDFDARKLNPRASELGHSQGSELTPMLSLNNLPTRSGSESDHEGNVSPYLNMCPRIDEESDEVFETKQYNFRNAHNNLNRAVTNPTYITLEVDLEKKPQNISNNYMNINVPNGLVK
ncbi:vascular endothelial growth factor receptor 1 isoform X3 [Maniola jurtina]|uniref:vascular endothelial growth factor receptor 1 isoform X3 n=1 Tax=Maniola jurtina TaxID=191418 RepID=UPI001E68A1D0|nr:vascular endothelial growth factor receptor 1 isoform X3 [Maniola jurtina]